MDTLVLGTLNNDINPYNATEAFTEWFSSVFIFHSSQIIYYAVHTFLVCLCLLLPLRKYKTSERIITEYKTEKKTAYQHYAPQRVFDVLGVQSAESGMIAATMTERLLTPEPTEYTYTATVPVYGWKTITKKGNYCFASYCCIGMQLGCLVTGISSVLFGVISLILAYSLKHPYYFSDASQRIVCMVAGFNIGVPLFLGVVAVAFWLCSCCECTRDTVGCLCCLQWKPE